MARLRASWRTSLPVVQQPRNPQSESIARTPYHPNLRAAVPAATNLGPRWDAADRRDPGPWPAYRDEPVADHGAERGAALRQLPPRAQPRGLEQPCGIPLAVRVADHHPHARGAGGAGPGRHDRAPPRQAY